MVHRMCVSLGTMNLYNLNIIMAKPWTLYTYNRKTPCVDVTEWLTLNNEMVYTKSSLTCSMEKCYFESDNIITEEQSKWISKPIVKLLLTMMMMSWNFCSTSPLSLPWSSNGCSHACFNKHCRQNLRVLAECRSCSVATSTSYLW